MKRSLLFTFVLFFLLAPVALAQETQQDVQAREIGERLRCYVCENLSVADSPSDSAEEMRTIIRKKLANGESPEQIEKYFVDRYGVGILLEPPRQGFGRWLWAQPILVLLAGFVLLTLAAIRWVRARPSGSSEETSDEDLERYDGLFREELRRRRGSSP